MNLLGLAEFNSGVVCLLVEGVSGLTTGTVAGGRIGKLCETVQIVIVHRLSKMPSSSHIGIEKALLKESLRAEALTSRMKLFGLLCVAVGV